MLKTVLVPIAREGWVFLAIFAVATLLLFVWGPVPGAVGLVLTAWCAYFFRNPDRVTPVREGLIVSPADGVVQMITGALPPPELGLGETAMTRISVFMNVFDCHVNRIPVAGRVSRLVYVSGRFFNASLDKASDQNERQLVGLELADGRRLAMVQIAGLVARRIVCYLQESQSVRTGERFGLIRFGSRVDLYLPEGAAVLAVTGQRCVAGETVLGDLRSDEPPRAGEVR